MINNENQRNPNSQRSQGAQIKITVDVLCDLLLHIEQQSAITLKEMAAYLEAEHGIFFSPQAIQRFLKDVDVTWKIGPSNSPKKWDELSTLQRNHDYILDCATDMNRQVVFIDKTGFDLHNQRSHGYSSAGEPAVLSLVHRLSQITLVAALSKTGYIYYELFNSDGKLVKLKNGLNTKLENLAK